MEFAPEDMERAHTLNCAPPCTPCSAGEQICPAHILMIILHIYPFFSDLTQPPGLHSEITVKGHELDALLLQVFRVEGVVGNAMNTL